MSVCPICKNRFYKRVHNQKYCCIDCQKKAYSKNHNKAVKKHNSINYKIDYKPQPTIKPNQYIDDIVRECEAYNKEHGTRYTYGKFKVLKQLGKV